MSGYTGEVAVGGAFDGRVLPGLTITKVATNPFNNNCYLLRDTASGETLLIDAAGDPERLGLYGFGSSAHIVVQVARHEGRRVFGFVRPGDDAAAAFALELGCEWAGPSDEPGPEELDAAIIFAPVGALVPAALRAVRPGGGVVCGGIHMSDIPAFAYRLLWEERKLMSVANLTRADGLALMQVAAAVPLRVHVSMYPLAEANAALADLRAGRMVGAAVLQVHEADA